nr:BTB/POZ and MATH domain-containing protein 2-like [Aegilops tauschii subsp. strangulata]
MKKKINERRKYEAVRVVMTEAEEEARMHVEYAARMAVEQAALMASGEWSVAFDFALASACGGWQCLPPSPASGHHLLTFHDYSITCKGIPTGQCAKSRNFTVGGHRWRIDYYPNGIGSSVKNHVTLCLILDEDVPAGVKAKYSFCLAGETEEKQAVGLASAAVSNFCSWSRSCNKWDRFIKREDLESSKHLENDPFTVRCDIVVVHGYSPADHAVSFVSVPTCDLSRDLGELLGTGNGADVVFEVRGEIVAAHRCVLAARSLVFRAELLGPMKENAVAGVVVRVEDMEAEVFKALLRFAYTGSLPETRKEDEDVTCQHLLVAADRYGIERLKLICEEKLCKYIDIGTVATILALAEQHRCEGLKKACFHFLAAPANLRAVMATDGFQHLSTSCPSIIVELMAMSFGALAQCSIQSVR